MSVLLFVAMSTLPFLALVVFFSRKTERVLRERKAQQGQQSPTNL